ncbi:MAG TPA: LysM peptidoglycan-binding domain-containing protein [Terriglobales bacterium]|nr:LysM peptidoglycan-binding domain-containing protein [Terriglobales bacterium]
MRFRTTYLWLPVLLALSLSTISCDEAGKKKVAVTPPPAAMAPAVAPDPPPAPPQVQQPAAPKGDPVQETLDRAEREYQTGQANYAAGHLEAAKENFDRAVTVLLQGPVDVKSDERLQREFDKIIEGVNTLEMQALKEGDGFTEQKSEPAPIDEANEVTFPVDPNVRARAEEELKQTRSDLPLVLNDSVASYINFYSSRGRGTLERALVRSGRYRDMIARILKEEGVPQDLIYLAQAESGFHPLALSRAGARGMWQFMASRATGYGLMRNWWVDDRQDPEKATRAAARHLRDLYNQFGDWYLAMAAYNSGPGTVQAAVQRTGYADFWELYRRNVLPRETKNYVPIIVAVTIMAKNPAQYGLESLVLDAPLEPDVATVDYPVDLRLVAECVDTSLDTIRDLNPSLLRMTTPKDGSFELRLPAGTKEKFQQAIAAIPADKRVWWRYHKVAAGDTLASVAKKYRTTPNAIAQVNNLDEGELAADTKLIIPVTGRRLDPAAVSYSRRATRYRVRKGDTVLSVADDFGVSPEKIRKWNHLKGNSLRAGRTLLIYKPIAEQAALTTAPSRSRRTASKSANPKQLTASSKGRVVHTVKPGETLYSIANLYKTTVAALKRHNPRLSATLHPGDTVIIAQVR